VYKCKSRKRRNNFHIVRNIETGLKEVYFNIIIIIVYYQNHNTRIRFISSSVNHHCIMFENYRALIIKLISSYYIIGRNWYWCSFYVGICYIETIFFSFVHININISSRLHIFAQFEPLDKTKLFGPPYSHYIWAIKAWRIKFNSKPMQLFCLKVQ